MQPSKDNRDAAIKIKEQSALMRWNKEIKFAMDSKDFIAAYYDADSSLMEDEPKTLYIVVKNKEGMYANMEFVVAIKFVSGRDLDKMVFPFNAPKVTIIPALYHANIYPAGSICLDVLRDDKWAPMYGVNAIVQSMSLLLETPNTSSPANGSASQDYSRHHKDAKKYRAILEEKYRIGMTKDIIGLIEKIKELHAQAKRP
jgi:ubiquitin-protein ligase